MTVVPRSSLSGTPVRDAQGDLARAVAQYRLRDARDAIARGAHPDGAAHTAIVDGTLLAFALNRRHEPMVQLLVAHGADVVAPRAHGLAPVHLAAQAGLVSSLALLIRQGADPCALTTSGTSALEVAFRAKQIGVAEYLLRTVPALRDALGTDRGTGPLHQAASALSRAGVRLARQYGGHWEAVDGEGWSPLQRAIQSGADAAFVAFAVAQGASVHAHTPVGTPLDVAVRTGTTRALSGLLDAGALWTAETTAALDQLTGDGHTWTLTWIVKEVAARRLDPTRLSGLLLSRVAATRTQALFLLAGPASAPSTRTAIVRHPPTTR